MIQGIYKIVLGEVVLYVGQSRNIEDRWREHKRNLVGGIHPNKYLGSCFRQDPENVIFELIEEVEDIQILTSREIFWIKELSPKCNFLIPDENDTWSYILSEEAQKRKADREEVRRLERLRWLEEKPERDRQARIRRSDSRKSYLFSLTEEERLLALGGMSGKKSWNSGKTIFTDPRLVDIGKSISKARQGIEPWNKGQVSYLKGQTKYTSDSIRRQSESLSSRPLVKCPECSKEIKVLKRHWNKYHSEVLTNV